MARKRLAGCIILDKQGRMLLLHRNTTKRQQWEIPGGKLEASETSPQAAIRELKEELDVGVQIIKKLGDKEFAEDGHTLAYEWFLAVIVSGVPRIMEPKTFDGLQYVSGGMLQKTWGSLSANTQNFLKSHGLEYVHTD